MEPPSAEVLQQHGLAVWIAVIAVVGAFGLVGFMFRHLVSRVERLESFNEETLVGLVEDSSKAHRESTEAIELMKSELEKLVAKGS